MNILFVSNLYPPIYVGGYEQVCFDVAQGLRARGHIVRVLTSSFRAEEIREHEPWVARTLRRKANGSFSETLKSPTALQHNAQMERHNVRVVRRVLNQFHPDVCMIWNGAGLGYGILGVLEQYGHVSYYLHDMWLPWVLALQRPGRLSGLLRKQYRSLLGALDVPAIPQQFNHLIFISRFLQQQHALMGMNVDRSLVIYNGLAPDLFSLRPQHILQRQPSEPHRILFCGQIKAEKGVSTLIEAFHQLRQIAGLENTTLSLLGAIQSEAYGVQLRERIVDLGLADAVMFLPARPRAQVPEVFAEHDVFAFPSQWGEPFALALLEAMATGIPVVAALDGGAADILRNGENAVVFAPRDVDELTRKLEWILTHPQEAAAIGQTASKQLNQHYRLDNQIEAIEGYLQAMAAESILASPLNRV